MKKISLIELLVALGNKSPEQDEEAVKIRAHEALLEADKTLDGELENAKLWLTATQLLVSKGNETCPVSALVEAQKNIIAAFEMSKTLMYAAHSGFHLSVLQNKNNDQLREKIKKLRAALAVCQNSDTSPAGKHEAPSRDEIKPKTSDFEAQHAKAVQDLRDELSR